MSKEDNERFWNKFFAPENFEEYLKEMQDLERTFEQYQKMYEQEFLDFEKAMRESGRTDFTRYRILQDRVRYWRERIQEIEEALFRRQLEYKRKMKLG